MGDYEKFYKEITKYKGPHHLNFRRDMAEKAFLNTAFYDASISNYFTNLSKNNFPEKKIISKKIENLRYGENPHQKAAFYSLWKSRRYSTVVRKNVSYNNYNDIYSAISYLILYQKTGDCNS